MFHGRAALSNPNILLLIGALEPVETEPKYEVVGAALVLGPFLGGILLENFGGRSPFAFAAVLGFIALLAMTGFVPAPWPRIEFGWDSDSDAQEISGHSPAI